MALTEIANENMVLVVTEDNPPGTVVATITIAGAPSIKSKAGGKGVYLDGLQLQITNITAPSAGATLPDPASVPPLFYPAVLSASALKVKADNKLVLRVNDVTSVISATPLIPGSPPVNYPVTFKVKVSNAGQIKVKAQ